MNTTRLSYRRVGAGDLDVIAALSADPEVMRYLGDGRPMMQSRVVETELPRLMAHNSRSDDLGYWAAFSCAAGDDFVGWFGVTPCDPNLDEVELGYRIARSSWGHGYATEGAQLMVSLAIATGARRVVATTMAVNTGSRRVLDKVGLSYVRTWLGEWDEPIPGAELGDVDYALEL